MPLSASFWCCVGLDSSLLCASAVLGALSSLQGRRHKKHCNLFYILKVLLTSSSKQGCAIPAETAGHAPGNKAVVEVEKHAFLSQFGYFLAPRDRVAKNGPKK